MSEQQHPVPGDYVTWYDDPEANLLAWQEESGREDTAAPIGGETECEFYFRRWKETRADALIALFRSAT